MERSGEGSGAGPRLCLDESRGTISMGCPVAGEKPGAKAGGLPVGPSEGSCMSATNSGGGAET